MDCAHSGGLDFYQLDGDLLCAFQAKFPEAPSKVSNQQTLGIFWDILPITVPVSAGSSWWS